MQVSFLTPDELIYSGFRLGLPASVAIVGQAPRLPMGEASEALALQS
jgi:hypothetical protein